MSSLKDKLMLLLGMPPMNSGGSQQSSSPMMAGLGGMMSNPQSMGSQPDLSVLSGILPQMISQGQGQQGVFPTTLTNLMNNPAMGGGGSPSMISNILNGVMRRNQAQGGPNG